MPLLLSLGTELLYSILLATCPLGRDMSCAYVMVIWAANTVELCNPGVKIYLWSVMGRSHLRESVVIEKT